LTSTEFTTLAVAAGDGVARITLMRPEKRNAMNPRMHDEMAALLPALNDDPAVRVIVITGAGESFCAGADIKEFFRDLEHQPVLRAKVMETARRWMWESLAQSPKATIAMINGHCFGGGLLVALACDIAIAGDRAVFGLPEINWGHIPGGAASLKTIETMGARMAIYYAMTGENFDATIAARTGLITKAVPHDRLEADVTALATTLAAKSPIALQTVKEIYRAAPRLGLDGIHDFVAAKIDQLRVRDTEGLRNKGMTDFIGKRLRTTGEAEAK
jgi:trans-feruloyl-CoA hydratase/vanillin synthase